MRCAGVVGLLVVAACGERAAVPVRVPPTDPPAGSPSAAGSGDLQVLPLVSRAGVDDRDPLAPGVISRIGTLRFRADDQHGAVRFLGDAVMHESRTIVGFDLASGKRLYEVDQALVMAQSEDGRLAVALTFEDDCTGVRLFEVPSHRTLACRHERDGSELEPGEWALSARGRVVVEVDDKALQVLDEQLQTVATIEQDGAEEVERWGMSADGRVLAALWRHPELDHRLRIYQLPGGEPLPVPAAAAGVSRAVALSADGRILAVARDRDIRIIERRSGRLLSTLAGVANRMKLSADGALLVHVSDAGPRSTVVMWDTATGRRLWGHALGDIRVFADDYAFSADGTRLAYPIGDLVRVVEARTGRDLAGISGPVAVGFAVLSADGRRVATASLGWVALWDADSGRLLRSFRTDDRFDGLQFARDGRSVYGFIGGEELVQFPVASGRPVRHRLPGCGGERSLQLPDGRTWVLECDDGLAVWQAQPPRTLRRIKVPIRDVVHAVAIDPAGSRIAMASDDMAHGDVPSGSLRIDVIDTRTWSLQTTRAAMSVQTVRMAILPDGRLVLDGKLLDPATGALTELGAWLVTTTADAAVALMARGDEPHDLFLWPVDRPLTVPPTAASRGDQRLYVHGVSARGRLLECRWLSVCQVRILR